LRFIDLYAGIGGFRLGFEREGHECVWSCEIDKYCQRVYRYRWEEPEGEDIREVDPESIPEFEILLSGFPCQSFSLAGERGGFEDTRGTLFHEICRVLRVRRPPHCLLENVEGLLSTQEREAFRVVLQSLDGLGYNVSWQVLNSKDFGVPQNRPRVFVVGHLREAGGSPWEILPIAGGEGETSGEQTEELSGGEGLTHSINSCYWHGYNPCEGTTGSKRTHIEEERGKVKPELDVGFQKSVYNPSGISPTVREGHGDVVRIASRFGDKQAGGVYSEDGICPTVNWGKRGPFPHHIMEHQAKSALIHSRGLETKDEDVSHALKGAGGGWSKNFLVREIIQKSPDWRRDGTLREFGGKSPAIRRDMGDNLPMVTESREGKLRVHRNDKKKSEIQGYSLFDEGTDFVDVVDGHDRRIIEHGGRKKINPKLLDLVPSLRSENHGHQPKVVRWQNEDVGPIVGDEVPSLRASGGTDIRKMPKVLHACFPDGIREYDDESPAIQTPAGGGHLPRVLASSPVCDLCGRFLEYVEPRERTCELCGTTEETHFSCPKGHFVCDKCDTENAEETLFVGGLEKYRRFDDGKNYSRNFRQGGRIYSSRGISPALSADSVGGIGGETGLFMTEDVEIRKLTPIECERLQGFPDDWTRWGLTGDGERVEISDTQRYKMLGNAVTVNVAEFLAGRYRRFEEGRL